MSDTIAIEAQPGVTARRPQALRRPHRHRSVEESGIARKLASPSERAPLDNNTPHAVWQALRIDVLPAALHASRFAGEPARATARSCSGARFAGLAR
jgi:hypothetical protein